MAVPKVIETKTIYTDKTGDDGIYNTMHMCNPIQMKHVGREGLAIYMHNNVVILSGHSNSIHWFSLDLLYSKTSL